MHHFLFGFYFFVLYMYVCIGKQKAETKTKEENINKYKRMDTALLLHANCNVYIVRREREKKNLLAVLSLQYIR